MSGSNCCFMTCIQVSQEAGKVVWYSHLLKNFPQFVVIHTVKGFTLLGAKPACLYGRDKLSNRVLDVLEPRKRVKFGKDPACLRNSSGRLDFPGPTQEAS